MEYLYSDLLRIFVGLGIVVGAGVLLSIILLLIGGLNK